VETTVVAEGFLAAWEAASARIRRAGGRARAGFVTVAGAWDAYPSLSVPATELNLLPPDPAEREQAASHTAAGLETALYDRAAAAIEADLPGLRGDGRLRALNRLAMLHGRFGREEAARAALREALEVDPDAAASRVNLANLALASGDYAEARRVLLPAYERRPASVVINALLARVERELGNGRAAERYADLVRRRDPDLARRYALLDTETTARAAAEPDGAALVWPESPGDL
jgi:predicted Zn-dependent protease